MDIPKSLEYAVSQKYKFYVYAPHETEEEVIIEKVKEVLSETSVTDCVFEVIRHKYVPADKLVFSLLPLYKYFNIN